MEPEKSVLLTAFFDQIESQVQFGDQKASLLIAGDAILLAISGGAVKFVSRCPSAEISLACFVVSPELILAACASALFIGAIVLALLAARPSSIHLKPTEDFFLLSHVARLDEAEFIKAYRTATPAELTDAALRVIHGKARFAAAKFRRLRHAVHCTVLGLAAMAAAVVVAIVRY